MLRYLLLAFFTFALSLTSIGHPFKAKYYVVVNTDGSTDDYRILKQILQSSDIRVLAITTSNGKLPALLASQKVYQLLYAINQQGILVGTDTTPVATNRMITPDQSFEWGNPVSIEKTMTNFEVLSHLSTFNREPITWLNLSQNEPLTAYLINNPTFYSKLKGIIKYGEMDANPNDSSQIITAVEPYTAFAEVLNESSSVKNQTFVAFPTDTALFVPEIRKYITNAQQKFGADEWQACVITAELHRHIGVYAMIGAKMGIRARQYFGAGVDELKVNCYSGFYPPVSCFADGIQASTGATLGHGLINILPSERAMAKAEFEYLGQKIVVTLNPEYENQIKREIKELELVYGVSANEYWEILRVLTFEKWFSWDRNLIFNIEKQ